MGKDGKAKNNRLSEYEKKKVKKVKQLKDRVEGWKWGSKGIRREGARTQRPQLHQHRQLHHQ